MTTTTRPVARTTWEAAAARAARAPDHRLPCPGCAASVRGTNLTAHVHRAHLSGPTAMAAGHPVHVGADRRMGRTAGWAATLWLAALGGLAVVDPERAGPVLLAGLAVLGAGVLLRRTDRAPARVAVTDREVVLQHRCGTGIVRVALPAGVETGALVRRVGEDGDDERTGTYLRVGDGRRAVTVGCPSGTRVRAHWSGWTPGPARRRWDVTLAPGDFVAFQYALAAAGALVPRAG